jgi:hypothetical protein
MESSSKTILMISYVPMQVFFLDFDKTECTLVGPFPRQFRVRRSHRHFRSLSGMAQERGKLESVTTANRSRHARTRSQDASSLGAR